MTHVHTEGTGRGWLQAVLMAGVVAGAGASSISHAATGGTLDGGTSGSPHPSPPDRPANMPCEMLQQGGSKDSDYHSRDLWHFTYQKGRLVSSSRDSRITIPGSPTTNDHVEMYAYRYNRLGQLETVMYASDRKERYRLRYDSRGRFDGYSESGKVARIRFANIPAGRVVASDESMSTKGCKTVVRYEYGPTPNRLSASPMVFRNELLFGQKTSLMKMTGPNCGMASREEHPFERYEYNGPGGTLSRITNGNDPDGTPGNAEPTSTQTFKYECPGFANE